MELRHLRHFVAVAEELHFGRAAERLHVAQPAVSAQIRRLEKELGVRLLVRSSRKVGLTEAGRAFLEEARASLDHSERAARKARQAASAEAGRLRVGLVGCTARGVLARVVGPFRGRFPEASLALRGMNTAPQIEALRAGHLDVGFVRLPSDYVAGDLEVEVVWEEPLVAVLPADHPLAALRRVGLGELSGEPFVIADRTQEPGWDRQLRDARERSGFAPAVVAETAELSVALGLVGVGAGVTLLPASARGLKAAGVVYRTLAPPAPKTTLSVAYSPASLSPTAREFLEFARDPARR